MIFINARERSPDQPGYYFVMGRFWPDLNKIRKQCIMWKYGFWHVGKGNVILEWMPNDITYSEQEVIEILRNSMFGGTPDIYDNGGLHSNHRLAKNHTITRATKEFEKYKKHGTWRLSTLPFGM